MANNLGPATAYARMYDMQPNSEQEAVNLIIQAHRTIYRKTTDYNNKFNKMNMFKKLVVTFLGIPTL